MLDQRDVALALLAGTEGLYALGLFMPSLMTMDAFATTPQAVAMIRKGMMHGVVFALIIGVTTSVVAKSWLPLFFVLLGLGFGLYVYETTLRAGSGEGPIRQGGTSWPSTSTAPY